MALYLTSYLEDEHLYEALQSTYKKSYSAETALLKFVLILLLLFAVDTYLFSVYFIYTRHLILWTTGF